MGGVSNELVISVPTERLAADIRPLPEGVEVLLWAMDAPAPRPHIDLVVPPYMSMTKVLTALEGVSTRLVQSQSIGYEGVAELLEPGTVFANASSVHETSTAELALALTLAMQRRLPTYVLNQQDASWSPKFAQSLADRRVLLLGFGGIGKAIAARLAPFEVSIRAVATRARVEDGIQVHAMEELPDLLGETDIVIASLPGGDATRHLVNDEFLRDLPDGALVVNVGRGPLIDTDALVQHAQAGRIRAALDVTDPEPLPAEHPLWAAPGVLIVPHVGGASSAMQPRIARLVRTQVERMVAGEPPLNVVIGDAS